MTDSQQAVDQIAAAARQNGASYRTGIPPEIEPIRRLLEYNGIASSDVDAHIRDIVSHFLLVVCK